jgi:hypothetical protein
MNQIEIFVPTTIAVSAHADTALWQEAAKKLLANLFGGFTVFQTTGGYVANNGELVQETIFVVTSFTDDTKLARYAPIVRGFCRNMARALGQESVMFRLLPVTTVEFIN